MRVLIETTPVDGGEPVLLEVVHAGCEDGCQYCSRPGVLPAGEYAGPAPFVAAIHRYEGSQT